MREIRTYGLKRGPPHRQYLGGALYSTKEFTLTRNRQSDRKAGGTRGDPNAEALPYKQVSRNASEPLMLRLVITKTPCGQRVIKREAEKMCRSRFAARKAWRGREGRRVWKAALGTWEVCGAKASAEVGRGHSSVEAGQCPWSEGPLRVKGNVSIKWGQAA